jgi:hypothetical protein
MDIYDMEIFFEKEAQAMSPEARDYLNWLHGRK